LACRVGQFDVRESGSQELLVDAVIHLQQLTSEGVVRIEPRGAIRVLAPELLAKRADGST
jgi:hypothetical protein